MNRTPPSPRVHDDPGPLVERARTGDAAALTELLDRLHPYVARICGSIALDDGPDATQESLTAVFRNLHRLDDPSAVFGWARTIATREALRIARARTMVPDRPLDDLADPGSPFEMGSDVRSVLAALPPRHRAILVLRDLEGLSESEAARRLGVADGTAKSRLHRARAMFRELWSREP